GLHVDLVEVRPLLAIDLDVDVELVHHARDVLVLERLALHHVAPMAGAVADRYEERFVLAARLLDRLRSEREPVDRVPLMLQEVGAFLPGEPVRPAARASRGRTHRLGIKPGAKTAAGEATW